MKRRGERGCVAAIGDALRVSACSLGFLGIAKSTARTPEGNSMDTALGYQYRKNPSYIGTSLPRASSTPDNLRNHITVL